MRRRILIVHPAGTISTNPNISGIVEILCEQGYEIDIWSPAKPFLQEQPRAPARLVLRNKLTNRIVFELLERGWLWLYKPACWLLTRGRRYQLVIGVDRLGIMEAQVAAEIHHAHCAMISYEILFEEETGATVKKPERAACRSLAFAVCQDRVRSAHLARENGIPLDKIIDIPVAGRSVVRGNRTQRLHHELGIPRDKKIVLFAGSVAPWTMIDELLQSTERWPEDWVLVLHCYAGLNEKLAAYVQKYGGLKKLYVSTRPVGMDEMHQLMHAVDMGIAMYKARYPSVHTGKNIEYMGMSSGKISTYLQHGIPVLVNEIGEMADYVRDHALGIVVESPKDIPEKLARFDPETCRENCYTFFAEKLDLDETITPLLKEIETILSC